MSRFGRLPPLISVNNSLPMSSAQLNIYIYIYLNPYIKYLVSTVTPLGPGVIIFSRFREIISHFREIISHFREIISRFREIISRFREIISHFREITSRFREIISRSR